MNAVLLLVYVIYLFVNIITLHSDFISGTLITHISIAFYGKRPALQARYVNDPLFTDML